MARFPLRLADIAGLAQSVAAGLQEHPELFADPPVSGEVLAASLADLMTAQAQVAAAQAAALQATRIQQEYLATLSRQIRADLRYAENHVAFADEKLKYLGWSAPRTKRPAAAPGQALMLTATRTETGAVALRWHKPADGGRPAGYKIYRRHRAAESGRYEMVELALTCRAILPNQPAGAVLEYRIAAVNRSGEGPPSNTATVI